MDQARLSSLLKRLVCPRCRKRYVDSDLLFVTSAEPGLELNLRCARCKLRIRMAAPAPRRIRRRPRKVVGAARRSPALPITLDDVQEMRRLLSGFPVSMEQLLGKIH